MLCTRPVHDRTEAALSLKETMGRNKHRGLWLPSRRAAARGVQVLVPALVRDSCKETQQHALG